tara:strand:+ start:370 stop:534 length:165 start_codon:yes stop_codon:yes gene_type:complete
MANNKDLPETKEQEEERHKFADELFKLMRISPHLLSDEEFKKRLYSIKKPAHMP